MGFKELTADEQQRIKTPTMIVNFASLACQIFTDKKLQKYA